MCLLLRPLTGAPTPSWRPWQQNYQKPWIHRPNLGIKRQKAFTFENGNCSGGIGIAPLLYPQCKGGLTCVVLPSLSFIFVCSLALPYGPIPPNFVNCVFRLFWKLGMTVATPAMVSLPPLAPEPDPGKSGEELCHTSIRVRNSKLGFTTTIYSSNNNNNHTFFSKFWHNSRVCRVQQIPARGSFLGSSKCCVLA